MAEDGIEKIAQSIANKRLTRRDVIKGTAAIALQAAIATTIGDIAHEQLTSDSKKSPQDPIEKSPQLELPADILTYKQLEEAHIRIPENSEVKLFLRESALNLPLFKDAKEGLLDEVVIVLVNAPYINKETLETLPDDLKEPIIESALLQESKHIYGTYINFKHLLESDKRYQKFKNKIFIHLAIGGNRTPKPEQSFPSPASLEKSATKIDPEHPLWSYRFHPNTPGFALWHEVKHYEQPFLRKPGRGGESQEYDTDTLAYENIAQASQKFIYTGDSSDFPFVFVTKEGADPVSETANDYFFSLKISAFRL